MREYFDVGERARIALVLVCAALVAAGACLPWLAGGTGGSYASYSLLDLPVVAIAVGVAVATMVVGAALALAGRERALAFVAVAAIAVAMSSAAFVVVTEALATFLPERLIPVTARRLALATGAGVGAWLALLASVGATFAAWEPARRRAADALRLLGERGLPAQVAVAGLAGAVVLLTQLRQMPWIEATTGDSRLLLDGVALPWLAPLTLIAVWLIAAGVALACLGAFEFGALVAAGAGWVVNLVAALAIAATEAVSGVSGQGAEPTAAIWATFWIGLGAGLAAAVLLRPGATR